MNFKDKLIMYLYNKSTAIEIDYQEHIQYTRFHNLDEVDYLESIIRKVRRDTYDEIRQDIYTLLSLSDKTQINDLQKTLNSIKRR